MSTSISIQPIELSKQLHDILTQEPDAQSSEDFFTLLDAKVEELRLASDGFINVEEELHIQDIHHKTVDHATDSLYRLEIFLRILHSLQPIISPDSLISTWFDLVLRPALREPGLSPAAMERAKQLLFFALTNSSEPSEKAAEFQQRIVDLYLLDALNDGSEADILEWSQLDDEQRRKRMRWKYILEDTCVRFGLHMPEELFTIMFHCFMLPSTRLQIVLLLDRLVSHSQFFNISVSLASHPLLSSLLLSLQLDKSSTLCSTALNLLFKFVPMMAIKAPEDLKRILPKLFSIMARVICWKARELPATFIQLKYSELVDPANENIVDELEISEAEEKLERDVDGKISQLSIRQDLEWECLESSFSKTESFAPSPHHYFSILYYLFPCSLIAFLRRPADYLETHGEKSPYTVGWDEALDEPEVKTRSAVLMRSHAAHPSIIWSDAKYEMDHMTRWTTYNLPRIIGECTMLKIHDLSKGLNDQKEEDDTVDILRRDRATGLDAAVSLVLDRSRFVAQESNDIVDDAPQPAMQSTDEPFSVSDAAKTNSQNNELEAIPHYILDIITGLQREVLLSRNDLDLELWMKKENIWHIERLHQDNVVSKSAEVERQGLHNKLREYKMQLKTMKEQLKKAQNEALTYKGNSSDAMSHFQKKVDDLRGRSKKGEEEASAFRAENKEIKGHLAAQSKLLAEAQNKLFLLETKIKEDAHKVQRLRDYEKRIEQLTTMHKLWNHDVEIYNEQAKYIDILVSDLEKMKIRVQSSEESNKALQGLTRRFKEQIHSLEQKVKHSTEYPDESNRYNLKAISADTFEHKTLSQSNERLRSENASLVEQGDELRAHVQLLKAQLMEKEKHSSP